MTAPPGGPYGQDPYGTNPYGQDPQWGGQPQGYPYPQGDPYQQGGTYPYPQGGVNPPAAPGYPPQQYPQPGQQVPPGWSTGSYPPGPPGPPPKRSKLPWLILAGVALVGVIALVLILVFAGGNGNKSNNAATTTAGPTSATSEPPNTEQTATDCTPNVSPGDKPTGDTITAGKLSFPASAAPGWEPFTDDQTPNLIGAVGLSSEVPGASQWIMQAEVGVTNFVPSMSVSAQASKLMQCIAIGPGYANASPTLGPTKSSSIKVDGVTAERLEADISIGDTSRNVKGDTVTIVAVATKPVTIFMGATPIGDAASAGIINGVIAALKVAKS